MLSVQSHYARIREVVQASPAIDPYNRTHITDSWIRCSTEHNLDPAIPGELYIIEHAELLERQDRFSSVLRAAKTEMAVLFQQIANADYAIMLTDLDGVLLNHFCASGFTQASSKSGLMPGAVWSERHQGTNGMGTCLIEQQPILIQKSDHYLFRNTGLTCAAAPIFDWQGQLLAVLDASSESKNASGHVLDLVRMSAKEIENSLFIEEFQNSQLFIFHSRSEFLGTLSKGIIALDAYGEILAASRNAVSQLGVSAAQIVGKPLNALFSVSFEALARQSRNEPHTAMPIFDTRDGRRFFGMLSGLANTGSLQSIQRHQPEHNAVVMATGVGVGMGANDDAAALKTDSPLHQLMYGPDAAMQHNIDTALRIFERDVAIMLHGETGTGKELFAKAVHLSSSRAEEPYVAINCAAIPEHLIESELFGYKPGAFTGASKEGREGKILHANGGTLFLDEIGDMPIALQTRLLRVLEEREISPLGSKIPIKLDIRLISATHCHLPDKIANNEFRQDLFYRIQGITLTLPPLRERADRLQLIHHVLKQEAPADETLRLDSALQDILMRHSWPGNIRQLRNVLRVLVAMREGTILTPKYLPDDFLAAVENTGAAATGSAQPTDQEAVLNPLEMAERNALIQELKNAHWNVSRLAKQLQISRNTLYRKLERLDIQTALRDQY
jgi:transcriptional regulator of acetoin/glycerol metabolism